MKAILDEQQRVELRHNIKRGQRDTVRQGRSPGGIAYGYRTANVIDATGRPVRGLRVIDPDQAKVVQRIFEEYAAGLSPVKIAQRLNHEGIPGPRGDRWRATTVRPDRSRGNGLLQNQLYIGRIVNNRTSKIVEPVTRKTRIRPNPEAEWVVQEAPNLRIIDQDLWDRVQQGLRRVQGHPPVKTRRERHLLSGLGLCGMCGGSWTIQTSVYWGCSSRKEGSNCSNGRSISTEHYQRRVLAGLQEKMLEPELVDAFVDAYRDEYQRRERQLRTESARIERRLTLAQAKVERLVKAISDGAGEFEDVRDALASAKSERDAARAEQAELDALPTVALHPTIAADYRRQISELHVALSDPEARVHAIPAVRALIDRVVLTPKSHGRGVEIEVNGKLAAIVALATGEEPPEPLTAKLERVKGIEPSS